MSQTDEYSPTVEKKPYSGRSKTMSESTRSQTVHVDSLCAILSRLHISYDGDKIPLRITNEFWPDGTPIYLLPDARIHDARYFDGVFEVDGRAHLTHGGRRWDERKDAYYQKMGLWVERVQNKDVFQSHVVGLLEKHRRKTDSYGGVL